MSYYCDTCLREINTKSKHSHPKSKFHKEFEKYKHIMFSIKMVTSKTLMKSYIYT